MNLLLVNQSIRKRNEAASLSYLDRGYVFGDGIYEMIRVYGGQLFEAEAHYRRLERSLREIRLEPPYPLEQLDRYLRQMIKEEQLDIGHVYMQITRGAAPRTHAFPEKAEPALIAYASVAPRPVEAMDRGIRVIAYPDLRWLRCDIKTLNLLPNVLAKQEALDRGVDDVIFHRDGTVTESSSSNVMAVRNGTLHTHPANHLILHGITRQVVLELAQQLQIPVAEQAVTLEELRGADEVFITSTTAEVTPVIRLDGEAVGTGEPGPVARRLQAAFLERIRPMLRD